MMIRLMANIDYFEIAYGAAAAFVLTEADVSRQLAERCRLSASGLRELTSCRVVSICGVEIHGHEAEAHGQER